MKGMVDLEKLTTGQFKKLPDDVKRNVFKAIKNGDRYIYILKDSPHSVDLINGMFKKFFGRGNQ